jgi:hypothetical protein
MDREKAIERLFLVFKNNGLERWQAAQEAHRYLQCLETLGLVAFEDADENELRQKLLGTLQRFLVEVEHASMPDMADPPPRGRAVGRLSQYGASQVIEAIDALDLTLVRLPGRKL